MVQNTMRSGESIEAAVSEAAVETGLSRSTIFQMMADIKEGWAIDDGWRPDDGPADASGEG
jgi:hypothetical protein